MTEILAAIKSVMDILSAMGVRPILVFAAFLVYLWVAENENQKNKWWADCIPTFVCFIGQLAFTLKELETQKQHWDLIDIVMGLFMIIFQAALAHMLYRLAFRYGWFKFIGMSSFKKEDKKKDDK